VSINKFKIRPKLIDCQRKTEQNTFEIEEAMFQTSNINCYAFIST